MDPFSLVFVCTGNRFRSPLAEAFVRRLTLGLPVTTRSFGVLNLEGSPALDEAIEIALSVGVDLSKHRARQVGIEPLGGVDLLLGFEQSHIRKAVVDASAPAHRSFTLLEFVGLAEDVPRASSQDLVRRARETVEHAVQARSQEAATSAALGIPDPFGRSWKVYRDTATEVRALSISLVASLFGVTDTGGLPELPPKLSRRKTLSWRRRSRSPRRRQS